MKIIRTDNFDRELENDLLIAENVDMNYGGIITAYLNRRSGREGPHYFQLVEDDRKLFKRDY